MTCHFVSLPGGLTAIVCTCRRASARCRCGRKATLLCDWKVASRKSGTCDAPLCPSCAALPDPELWPEKHLCADHLAAWWQRLAQLHATPEAK